MVQPQPPTHRDQESLAHLLELARQAREARSAAALNYLLVNGTHRLTRYRQAILWSDSHRPSAVSGVMGLDHTAPMMRWVADLYSEFLADQNTGVIDPDLLPDEIRKSWTEYFPAHAFWCAASLNLKGHGGLLLVRDTPWSNREQVLISEWWNTWEHSQDRLAREEATSAKAKLKSFWTKLNNQSLPWYKRRLTVVAGILLLFLLMPVRMTVIAPGQIVPLDPRWVRASIDGVIKEFNVQPSDRVQQGEILFRFEDDQLLTQVELAEQALEVARLRYYQVSQTALDDERLLARLAELASTLDERNTQLLYLQSQLERIEVKASQNGIVIFDDPSVWAGRPISIGQPIMRIVDPEATEIEAWVSVADAVNLPVGSVVRLHPHASPLRPVRGTIRYVAYDAVERPDGVYAYRLRAGIDGSVKHRPGAKGTARISGEWTTLAYWILRRPLGALRVTLGI